MDLFEELALDHLVKCAEIKVLNLLAAVIAADLTLEAANVQHKVLLETLRTDDFFDGGLKDVDPVVEVFFADEYVQVLLRSIEVRVMRLRTLGRLRLLLDLSAQTIGEVLIGEWAPRLT